MLIFNFGNQKCSYCTKIQTVISGSLWNWQKTKTMTKRGNTFAIRYYLEVSAKMTDEKDDKQTETAQNFFSQWPRCEKR